MESWRRVHFYLWFGTNLNGDKIIESFLDFPDVIGPNGSGSDRVPSLVSVVVKPRTTSHPLSYGTWPADRFSLWDAVLHRQPRLSVTAERFTPWNPRSLKVWVLLQFVIMACDPAVISKPNKLSPLWVVNRTSSEASSQSGSLLTLRLKCVNIFLQRRWRC